jgi:hypothetical protein
MRTEEDQNAMDIIRRAAALIKKPNLLDNVPLELFTEDDKKITIEYSSETKQLVIKAGANTLKSRLVN